MARAKSSKKQFYTESLSGNITAAKVDRDAGVIYGVRMGGLQSKNNREYTESAYRKATKLYEGKPCNVNHSKGEVLAENRFGSWQNVRYESLPTPGPVGDLHFLKSHPMADRVCEAAERPELSTAFGMSHTACAGKTRPGNSGRLIVEEIEDVSSVDLVADPATVKGLFESKRSMKTLKEAIEQHLNFPFQKKLWEAYAKREDACKRITESVEVADDAKPADAIPLVFNELAYLVVEDVNLSPVQKADEVKAIYETVEKLLNGVDEKPEQKTVIVESKAIGVIKAGQLCEALKYHATPKQLSWIAECDEGKAKEMVEEYLRLSLVKPEGKPESASRTVVTESKQTNTPKPAANPEELAARIK